MSNFYQSYQIRRAFESMVDGQTYILREGVWEEYQRERERLGWGRYGNRQDYSLTRRGDRLMSEQSLIWDFAANPAPNAFAFAFADADAAFAFAFAADFHANFEMVGGESRRDPPEVPNAFSEFMDLEHNQQDFWKKTSSGIELVGAVSGIPGNVQVELHLHNLPEEVAAKILALIASKQ